MSTATRTVDGTAVPAPGAYTIDPAHSSVEVIARHLMVSKVRGHLAVSGTFTVGEQVTDSQVDVSIDAASVNTREAQRDEHLRSGDFLDVANHPAITFRSSSVARADGEHWTLHGDLTVRGVTRPVDLDIEFNGASVDPWGGSRVGFSGTTQINREDFGITWNQALEAGGVMVGKVLTVQVEIEATAAA